MSQLAPDRSPLGLLRRFGPLAVVALGLVLAFASGLPQRLSLHALHQNRLLLLAYVHAHPVLCLGAYVGVYVLVVALSLPAALIMTLTGGLLFGPWVGGAAAATGCTLGSAVIFLVCRTAIGDALRGRAGSLVDRIERGIEEDAFAYVAALRLIPVAPFWLANLALGFVDIPLTTFVAATFVGIVPVSFVYAGVGSSLNTVFARGGHTHLHDLMHPAVVVPLVGLGLLALAPVVVRRLRRRR
ncbi:TVP38/TMEM64 family protein [Phenylobacterium montanum]|uniref:TVP38/TMEM64 family membrane protein n=1 Tax=Phenylobacterium montanum TaxID=2823693 RepID=A0A975FX10_9CAUL|nr:TVP38/TMEM64 family protein [Caulobacter sp. S6]QUD86497.1 TVP38/TMEM64 family protein [Caulobacter sp. S6]